MYKRRQLDFAYAIRDEIENLFNAKYLNRLHEFAIEEYSKLFEIGKDSSTVFHQKFYDRYRAGWGKLEKLYELVIKEVAVEQQEDFLYQKFPTFRVHLPNNVAVGAFHRDADFGHPAGEMNFVIPLTDAFDSDSIWVESEEWKEDFTPMMLVVGDLIEFNGNRLKHGNYVNKTGKTRVSMDFRILPISKYDDNSAGESITRKTKFVDGEYYKRFVNNNE